MKPILFIIIFSTTWFFELPAQQLSINVEGGYGFHFIPDYVVDGNVSINSLNNSSQELIRYSYGAGLQLGGSIFLYLSPGIKIGLNTSYLKGKIYTKNLIFQNTKIGVRTFRANMWRITPLIHLSLSKKKYDLYSKHGLIFGIGNLFLEEKTDYVNLLNKTERYEYYGGLSIGFTSAVGIQLNVNSNFSWFAEAELFAQSYGPRTRELVFYEKNGVDQIPTLTISQIFVDYKDEVNTPSGISTQNPDVPFKDLRKFYPFSSFGIKVGLVFFL